MFQQQQQTDPTKIMPIYHGMVGAMKAAEIMASPTTPTHDTVSGTPNTTSKNSAGKVEPGTNSANDKTGEEEEESRCKKGIFDFWDTVCYIIVKVGACAGRCPCLKSCRDGKHMREHVEAAHIGLPVTVDDFTNLINTLLLVSALFLSFVAGSATVLGDEQLLKNDLIYCQRGWAHNELCRDLDSGGYFGNFNATGLQPLSSAIVDTTQNADDSMMSSKSVELPSMFFGLGGDSMHYTKAQDIPSFAIMYYNALSIGLLFIVIFIGVIQYLILIISGARTMGDDIMQAYWASGIIAVVVQFVCMIAAAIFWLQSLSRIIGALNPSYVMHGMEFLYYTHADSAGDYAVFFSAVCIEGAILNLLFFVAIPCLIGQLLWTFGTEKNNMLADRPKHIAGFVMKALEPLEDDDCLGGVMLGNKEKAIYRVVKMFKDHGYKVGGEEDASEDEEKLACKEMELFIDEFNFLDWAGLSWETDDEGNKKTRLLSIREKARLHQLHKELYGQA